MTILSAVNLCKVFGAGETAVQALNDVSLDICSGDILGIIGASGSGKSTLLHLLSSLDIPTSGQVIYQGQDIFSLDLAQRARLRRRSFGFVFQFFNLVPFLTVEENIALPVLMDGGQPDKKHLNNLLEFLGLESKRRVLPHKLSGGQQQRVAIGRALTAKPDLVFADEPTGNLDSKTTKEIMGVFLNSARELKQTLVVVTHDECVASNCKRVVEIRDGQISGGQQ